MSGSRKLQNDFLNPRSLLLHGHGDIGFLFRVESSECEQTRSTKMGGDQICATVT